MERRRSWIGYRATLGSSLLNANTEPVRISSSRGILHISNVVFCSPTIPPFMTEYRTNLLQDGTIVIQLIQMLAVAWS